MTGLPFYSDFAIRSGFVDRLWFIAAKVEQRCLSGRVFAQLGHVIRAAWLRLFLFSLASALCFFPLSLLPCLFFLTLCKR
jgi:hypothetical protein